MSGVVIDPTGMKVCVKYGDSRSTHFLLRFFAWTALKLDTIANLKSCPYGRPFMRFEEISMPGLLKSVVCKKNMALSYDNRGTTFIFFRPLCHSL